MRLTSNPNECLSFEMARAMFDVDRVKLKLFSKSQDQNRKGTRVGLVLGMGFVIILGFALFVFLFPGAWRTRLLLSGVFLAWALAIRMGREALLSALNSMPPTCPLRAWFGIKCSFCGMTHALIHFLFFDFGAAISENPLSLPLFGFSLAGMLVAVIQPNVFDAAVGFLRRPGPRMVATWSALGVLGVFTLLRNL